ncbi:MAG: AsmA family protein [Flavobacteriales bacterium]|nr:AsmA family protein [Flavobacteriales bacterium]
MIKKFFIGFGILIVLLIASIVLLPIIFKDDIIQAAKDAANDNLNAQVDFGDFDVSLISSFPKFSFDIADVSVVGVDSFAGDTLVAIKSLELTLDVMAAINGQYNIKTFAIDGLTANAIVLMDSTANWDIVKASGEEEVVEEEEEEEEAPADSTAGPFSLELQRLSLTNINIVYDDRPGDMYAEIKNLNFEMSGDLGEKLTLIETATSIDAVTVKMGGVAYLNKAEIGIDIDIDADLEGMKFTFKENEFRLNALVLGWDGWVAMPTDDISMDVTFAAKKTEFKTFLSLIPAVYSAEFADVKTAGKLAIDGFAKGTMTETMIPAFGLNVLIENAMFQYPDLPGSVDNINLAVNIANPGGTEDATVIDVSKFHIDLSGNPMDVHLVLKTPISDPYIDCGFEGTIDLAKLKDAIPLEEGEDMSGIITSDLSIRGNLSTIEEERYEDFHAVGSLNVENLMYKSVDLPQGILIEKTTLMFSPKYVDLVAFDCQLGKSDFHATGKIENFVGFALTDSVTLAGSYVLTSNNLDLDEFMTEEEGAEEEVAEEEEVAAEDTVPLEVIEVPKRIDFKLASSFARINYDGLEMTNVKGDLIVKDQTVFMSDIFMNMLKGSMIMNGSYSTLDPEKPSVDFLLDIKDWDIPETFNTFNSMEKMAPIGKSATGIFSTGMKFVTTLDPNMEPVYESMNGGGHFITDKVIIEGSTTINKLADKLKNDKYKKLTITDLDVAYEFRDGRLWVEPFDIKLGKSKATIQGSNGFDETLDYTMDMTLPTSEFGGGAEVLGQLTGMLNSATGGNTSIGDEIKVQILITGTSSDPTVKLGSINPLGGDQSVKEAVKEQITEKIEEVKEEVKQEIKKNVKEQADKIIAQGEKQAAAVKAQTRTQCAAAKTQAYANADKVLKEARNPLQKAAAKVTVKELKKAADKAEVKCIAEGDKKADNILNAAKAKAAAL